MTRVTSNRFGRILLAFLRIPGFLRTILISESSVDPFPNAYYLERLRTDRDFHHPDGSFLQRDGRIKFKFDEPFNTLEFRILFGLYLCRYRKPDDHLFFSYQDLILAPTGRAYGEYQRVGVFNEPGQEGNYLEKANFVTAAVEIQDTPKPVDERQLVTIV